MSAGGDPNRSLAGRLAPHRRLVIAALVLVGLAAAHSHAFVQDDAYILYRYADHLAQGLGPVWNPGEPVEGYSCFSFTMVLAAGARAGLDPRGLSLALGLAGFGVTLLGSYALGRRLLGHWGWGAAMVFLVATHPVTLAWATGGMATSWLAALVVLGFVSFHRLLEPPAPRGRDLAGLSLVALLALLTRPEGVGVAAVWVAAGSGIVLTRGSRTERPRARLGRLVLLLAPLVAGAAIYALWKAHTFGDLVPNAVRAKAGGGSFYGQGGDYLWAFLRSTGLIGLLAAAGLWTLLAWWRARRHASAGARPSEERTAGRSTRLFAWLLGAFLLVYLAALARVGGDYMEFRALAPVLPVGFALYLGFVRRAAVSPWARLALLLLIPLGGLHHRLTFQHAPYRGRVETLADMRDHVDAPGSGWVAVGRALKRELGDFKDLWIATTASGAIPYFSGLPTVDMLGLNDRRVARGRVWRHQSIGHRRAATVTYLLERGVVLLFGHPRVVAWPAEGASPGAAGSGARFTAADRWALLEHLPDPEKLPPDAQLLAIPVGPRHAVVALALRAHAGLDERARKRRWPRAPLVSDRDRDRAPRAAAAPGGTP